MNYQNRRYLVIGGRLEKIWVNPPPEDWFVTKAEAWEAWRVAIAAAPKPSQDAPPDAMYRRRRYRVVNGQLKKKNDGDPEWFVTKADAWDAHAIEVAEAEKSTLETPPVNSDGSNTTPEPEVAEVSEPEVGKTPPTLEPEPEITEPVSQACDDDPFGLGDIPDFLRRSPGKTNRRQRPRKAWRMTTAMKAAAQKNQARREKIAARPIVLRAVEDGADTFGKVRKATGLPDPWIQSAIRHHVKERTILKTGKRYHATGQRRRKGE